MAEKKSTPFYHSWIPNLEKLGSKSKAIGFDLMLSLLKHGAFGSGLETDESDPVSFSAELLFTDYAGTIDRDTEKYFQRCEQNASNGSKGGRPKTERFSEKPKKTERFLEKAKKPDIDIDIDIDKDKEIDIDIDKVALKRANKKTKFHNFDERNYSSEQMETIEKKLGGN